MPVDRSYIVPYATSNTPGDSNLYQAFTSLANFADGLETAAGVRVGAKTNSTTATPPATASWTITAAGNGHYLIQITNPTPSGGGTQAAIQHQIASATTQSFDANSNTTTFTLGLGQVTLDIVDPHVTKYFRLQSRFAGSAWNTWLTYATAAGVVALASGALTV